MRTPTLLLFFLLLVPPSTTPSFGAAEKLLGAPRYDTVAETTYRQLAWEDFKGKGRNPSGSGRWGSGSWANVAVSYRVTEFKPVVESAGDGTFTARPDGLRVYAVLDKFQSAVQHGAHSDQTLAHEQAHFDLGEAKARRLTVTLMDLRGEGETAHGADRDLQQKIRAAFEEGFREMLEMQRAYDGETAHGAKRKQQKQWLEKIAKIFDEATRDLVARLDGA